LLSTLIAVGALLVPARWPGVSVIWGIFLSVVVLVSITDFVALHLTWNPGRRWRHLGERLWHLVTLVRLYPLWHLVTTAIPDVSPPVQMPWLAALMLNQLDLLRDARIIDILDALHRLNLTLWNEAMQHEWILSMQQIVHRQDATLPVPSQQIREVGRLADADAQRILQALAAFTPGRIAGPFAPPVVSATATLTHPPAFSAGEVHYLELVARAFTRLHRQQRKLGKTGEISVEVVTL
jgi:hypothetical protein